MPRIFDSYVVVDWSASSKPKTGKDSIWWCEVPESGELEQLRNPSTRARAYQEILATLVAEVGKKRRVLVGFDFPYGFPSGWAQRLRLSGTPWLAVWNDLSERIKDGPDNANNRFQVAADLNKCTSGKAFPFWGCPSSASCETLSVYSQWQQPCFALNQFRITERRGSGAQSSWKLFTAGSVGSQSLVGIPRLSALLHDPALRPNSKVWPFETGFIPPLTKPGEPVIIHAEIYPSLLKTLANDGEVKDACQVKALATHFCGLDSCGELASMFSAPSDLDDENRRQVEEEEGWILGIG